MVSGIAMVLGMEMRIKKNRGINDLNFRDFKKGNKKDSVGVWGGF